LPVNFNLNQKVIQIKLTHKGFNLVQGSQRFLMKYPEIQNLSEEVNRQSPQRHGGLRQSPKYLAIFRIF